jgi:hypothetical protein
MKFLRTARHPKEASNSVAPFSVITFELDRCLLLTLLSDCRAVLLVPEANIRDQFATKR